VPTENTSTFYYKKIKKMMQFMQIGAKALAAIFASMCS